VGKPTLQQMVGPDDNEIVYDWAIYFSPYFAEQQ
jgi:hypothetical protein